LKNVWIRAIYDIKFGKRRTLTGKGEWEGKYLFLRPPAEEVEPPRVRGLGGKKKTGQEGIRKSSSTQGRLKSSKGPSPGRERSLKEKGERGNKKARRFTGLFH